MQGHLTIEDDLQIFAVDMTKMPSCRVEEYLLSLGKVDKATLENIYTTAMKNKIFIGDRIWSRLGDDAKLHYYKRMIADVKVSRHEWVVNNSFNSNVSVGYSRLQCIKATRLELLPYTSWNPSLADIYKHRDYPIADLVRSFLHANKPLQYLPSEYNHADVDDELFGLYRVAVKRNLWVTHAKRALTRRLILAMSGMVYGNLLIIGNGPITSYILAHLPEDRQDVRYASQELIATAYRSYLEYGGTA